MYFLESWAHVSKENFHFMLCILMNNKDWFDLIIWLDLIWFTYLVNKCWQLIQGWRGHVTVQQMCPEIGFFGDRLPGLLDEVASLALRILRPIELHGKAASGSGDQKQRSDVTLFEEIHEHLSGLVRAIHLCKTVWFELECFDDIVCHEFHTGIVQLQFARHVSVPKSLRKATIEEKCVLLTSLRGLFLHVPPLLRTLRSLSFCFEMFFRPDRLLAGLQCGVWCAVRRHGRLLSCRVNLPSVGFSGPDFGLYMISSLTVLQKLSSYSHIWCQFWSTILNITRRFFILFNCCFGGDDYCVTSISTSNPRVDLYIYIDMPFFFHLVIFVCLFCFVFDGVENSTQIFVFLIFSRNLQWTYIYIYISQMALNSVFRWRHH